MSELYDWVESPKSMAEMDNQERIDWLYDMKKRYEDALNDIIYSQDVNSLVKAIERAKRALGVDD